MRHEKTCGSSRLSKALSGFEGLLAGLTKEEVGVDDGEGTPVPIPNTAVKLISADNTWLEAAREDKAMPTLRHLSYSKLVLYFALIAQSVEHAAVNRGVTGSSPV